MSAYPVFSLHKVQTGKANSMLLVGIEVSLGEVTGWGTGRLLEGLVWVLVTGMCSHC